MLAVRKLTFNCVHVLKRKTPFRSGTFDHFETDRTASWCKHLSRPSGVLIIRYVLVDVLNRNCNIILKVDSNLPRFNEMLSVTFMYSAHSVRSAMRLYMVKMGLEARNTKRTSPSGRRILYICSMSLLLTTMRFGEKEKESQFRRTWVQRMRILYTCGLLSSVDNRTRRFCWIHREIRPLRWYISWCPLFWNLDVNRYLRGGF